MLYYFKTITSHYLTFNSPLVIATFEHAYIREAK